MIIWPTPKPAVKTAISILETAFSTYALVSAKMPRQRPIRFVRVSRTGGGLDNPVTDRARLLVECFAPDPAQAEAMTATARTALRNAGGTVVDGVFVRAWDSETGPVELPHPDLLDVERWQFLGDLLVSTTGASDGS